MRLYHWIVWPQPPATPHLPLSERQPGIEAWLLDLSQNGTFVNRKLVRTAGCLLPAACCLLPAACCLLPASHCRLL